MCGAIPPLLQYVFMAWCLVKQRDNFTIIVNFTISTADQIVCIDQIMEKKWNYNESVLFIFIFGKAYDSISRKILYSILTEFYILMKLVRL
jgi:hypothetical protein